ncbi:MAG: hypothetical protein RhofKO_17040 [Rhodothermales bacterium]
MFSETPINGYQLCANGESIGYDILTLNLRFDYLRIFMLVRLTSIFILHSPMRFLTSLALAYLVSFQRWLSLLTHQLLLLKT